MVMDTLLFLHYMQGQKNGGKLLYGGKRVGDKGYYFEPTIFEVADNDAKIAQEEIFGPVQCVFKWRDMDKVRWVAAPGTCQSC